MIVSLAFAAALVCQRTDSAYAQWQLKTHAAIVAGYQRQLAAPMRTACPVRGRRPRPAGGSAATSPTTRR